MGLFNFFSRKEKRDDSKFIGELAEFSKTVFSIIKNDVEESGTFLPFGGILTTENSFNMIVYHDGEPINLRSHAKEIQKLMMEKGMNPKSMLLLMAWPGNLDSPQNEGNFIKVRADNKILNLTKIFTYKYEIINSQMVIENENDPNIEDI